MPALYDPEIDAVALEPPPLGVLLRCAAARIVFLILHPLLKEKTAMADRHYADKFRDELLRSEGAALPAAQEQKTEQKSEKPPGVLSRLGAAIVANPVGDPDEVRRAVKLLSRQHALFLVGNLSSLPYFRIVAVLGAVGSLALPPIALLLLYGLGMLIMQTPRFGHTAVALATIPFCVVLAALVLWLDQFRDVRRDAPLIERAVTGAARSVLAFWGLLLTFVAVLFMGFVLLVGFAFLYNVTAKMAPGAPQPPAAEARP
jgi:hypothetical protein